MRIDVLLAEDRRGDVRLTQEVFRDANKVVKSINDFWLAKVTLLQPQPEGR